MNEIQVTSTPLWETESFRSIQRLSDAMRQARVESEMSRPIQGLVAVPKLTINSLPQFNGPDINRTVQPPAKLSTARSGNPTPTGCKEKKYTGPMLEIYPEVADLTHREIALYLFYIGYQPSRKLNRSLYNKYVDWSKKENRINPLQEPLVRDNKLAALNKVLSLLLKKKRDTTKCRQDIEALERNLSRNCKD